MSEDRYMPFYQDVDGFRIPGAFSAEVFKKALKYKPEPGDFFVPTFPKCGTTWTQQIVTLIFNKGKPVSNLMELHSRSPFLEMLGIEAVEGMVKPGSIKVHLPYHLTPMSPDAKYLYVVRNPKDTVVSFYHHTTSNVYMYEDGKFDDFFDIFMIGENDYGDYFDHVLGWYEHRNDPNVLFVTYEELKRDTSNTIKKIGKFMGEQYGAMLEEDEDVLKDVLKYSSLEYMKPIFNASMETFGEALDKHSEQMDKKPPGLKHIMKFMMEHQSKPDKQFEIIRKGIVGDWRNNFSEDQAKRMDEKIEEKLKDTELYDYWKSIKCI